ncbi:MAG: DUF177 domain-containing protein [Candidatus Peregrinibacteria bacterium]
MKSPLIFDISHLISAPTGENETYSFEGPAVFDGIDLASDVSGKIEIMRIENGVNVAARDIKAKANLRCEKCLGSFTEEIEVKFAERQFLLEKPEEITDPNDTYFVDKIHLTIDLTEMLRQELILHFPVILVCSTRCKGICPYCGKNQNADKCGCKEEKPAAYHPLAGLKNLLDSKNGKTPGTKKENPKVKR